MERKTDINFWRGFAHFIRDAARSFLPGAIGSSENMQQHAGSTRVLLDRSVWDSSSGATSGEEQAPSSYGDYYAISAPVHAAVRVLAEAVSRPKLEVWIRKTPDADFVRAHPDHPMQQLLDRPNRFWSRGELWRNVESRLALWGSSFIAISRDDNGQPTEMWPLRSDQMRVLVSDDDRFVRGFIHENITDRRAYLPEEMIWFRRFNPVKPFAGMSSVAPARAAIDMGAEALRFNRRFFMRSASPADIVLKSEHFVNETQLEEIYARWDERLLQPHNTHRPMVIGPGLDLTRVGMTHRDMEFVAALEWSVEEAARAFGVPKVFLSEFEDATLANVRTMEQFLWRNTIIPELRMLEDGLNLHLAPHFAQFQGQIQARFNLDAVEAVQESANDRANRLASLVASGIISTDEARAELGLNVSS